MPAIDWLSFKVPCTHERIRGDRHLIITPEGEVRSEWSNGAKIRGSFDASIKVQTTGIDGDGIGREVYVSGNPAKWLQGHNLFSSDDPHALAVALLEHLEPLIGASPTAFERGVWESGSFKLTRVDIAGMWDVGSTANARSWLRAAESQSTTRNGRAVMTGSTLYFQKNSRRWTIKAYSKADELKAGGDHDLPQSADLPALYGWVAPLLRIELTLRGPELQKNGLEKAKDWGDTTPQESLTEYIRRIRMSEQISLSKEDALNLPPRLRMAYNLWKSGHDLRAQLPKNTYYDYRRALLKHGIDINVKQPSDGMENVVPLVRVIEAVPVEPPEWVYGTNLYYEPRALKSVQ